MAFPHLKTRLFEESCYTIVFDPHCKFAGVGVIEKLRILLRCCHRILVISGSEFRVFVGCAKKAGRAGKTTELVGQLGILLEEGLYFLAVRVIVGHTDFAIAVAT